MAMAKELITWWRADKVVNRERGAGTGGWRHNETQGVGAQYKYYDCK